jgi:hypothetical protein
LGGKEVGIFRDEFRYFVLPMINNDYDFIVREIIVFRKKFGSCSYKGEEYEKYLIDFAFQKLETKKEIKNIRKTSKDYADNVIRHFRLTGLVSFRGNTRFIDISEGFSEVVEKILEKFKMK